MAERIFNYAAIPPELTEPFEGTLVSERVQGLPEKFNDPEVDKRNMAIHNRLLMNLKAVKEDLLLLKLDRILTVQDYKGLVVFSNSELVTLIDILESEPSVVDRLIALEARVLALETP